jgi:hypothetical protein
MLGYIPQASSLRNNCWNVDKLAVSQIEAISAAAKIAQHGLETMHLTNNCSNTFSSQAIQVLACSNADPR